MIYLYKKNSKYIYSYMYLVYFIYTIYVHVLSSLYETLQHSTIYGLYHWWLALMKSARVAYFGQYLQVASLKQATKSVMVKQYLDFLIFRWEKADLHW